MLPATTTARPFDDETDRAAAPAEVDARVRSAPAARLDRWAVLVCFANVVQVALSSWLFPAHRLDPDLVAYFTYFRNWLAGDPTLHGLSYYTGPKALLVFTLGALDSVNAALACTMLASIGLGVVVYLIARDAFGRGPALAASLFLLLDPSKIFLTLKSSADLYLTLALFLAILLADRGRLIGAAVCIALGALIKPVALPCAAFFLAAPGAARRRWTAALLPLAAVPLILLTNRALLGSMSGGSTFFTEFASMAEVSPLGPGELVHWALWSQLIKVRFVSSASWGLLGVLLWIADDRARLTRPLVLMPLLFLCGYIGLAALLPFPPYFRYFWPFEVWLLLFVAYGALTVAARLASDRPRLRAAIAAVVFLLLGDSLIGRLLDYRRDYAAPIERTMRFAAAATDVIRTQGDQRVVAPLGLLPYLMWQLPDAGRSGQVGTAERLARDHVVADPDWIIDLPRMYKTAAARQWIVQLSRDGRYRLYGGDGESALLVRSDLPAATALSERPEAPPRPQEDQ